MLRFSRARNGHAWLGFLFSSTLGLSRLPIPALRSYTAKTEAAPLQGRSHKSPLIRMPRFRVWDEISILLSGMGIVKAGDDDPRKSRLGFGFSIDRPGLGCRRYQEATSD